MGNVPIDSRDAVGMERMTMSREENQWLDW